MCQDAGADLARLALIASPTQGRAEVAFEHAEYRFDLPTLAIEFLREVLLQRLAERLFVLDVGLRAAIYHAAEDERSGRVADGRELRIPMFQVPSVILASFGEVG